MINLPRLDGLHVLFVDDRRDARFVVQHILRDAGAEVTSLENGRDALDAVTSVAPEASNPFDVVVMDLRMPVLDGLEATREIRRQGYGVPILALSAARSEDEYADCLEAGCDDFLAKPIDGERLVARVHSLAQSQGATARF